MWPKGKTIDDAIVIGEQEGGLYKLKGYPEQALIHDIVETNELWHIRLAHVHYRALPIASKAVEGLREFQEKHDGVYKGCVKGKYKEDISKYQKQRKRNLGNHPFRCIQSYVIKLTKQVCILCLFY